MPRLPSSLLRRAYSIDPLLPLLLPPCRDLSSARNELRWLREHVRATNPKNQPNHAIQLSKLVLERSRGKPLQYILGTQPFGDLEILCKRGVLIPRPETESLTTHLASLLLPHHSTLNPPPSSSPLRILDLFTGTACIPLLLHSLLFPHLPVSLTALDISPSALSLARRSLTHNIHLRTLSPSAAADIRFIHADVCSLALDPASTTPLSASSADPARFDILTANPPYISPSAFASASTESSVRVYEPRLALVPPPPPSSVRPSESEPHATVHPADTFYPLILSIATRVCAQLVVAEVGDMEQAQRVVGRSREQMREGGWEGCEIWRDCPGPVEWGDGGKEGEWKGGDVRVRGAGEGRTVVWWRGERGRKWVGG